MSMFCPCCIAHVWAVCICSSLLRLCELSRNEEIARGLMDSMPLCQWVLSFNSCCVFIAACFSLNLWFKLLSKLKNSASLITLSECSTNTKKSFSVLFKGKKRSRFLLETSLGPSQELCVQISNIWPAQLKKDSFVIVVRRSAVWKPVERRWFICRMLMGWKRRCGAQEALRISALTHWTSSIFPEV